MEGGDPNLALDIGGLLCMECEESYDLLISPLLPGLDMSPTSQKLFFQSSPVSDSRPEMSPILKRSPSPGWQSGDHSPSELFPDAKAAAAGPRSKRSPDFLRESMAWDPAFSAGIVTGLDAEGESLTELVHKTPPKAPCPQAAVHALEPFQEHEVNTPMLCKGLPPAPSPRGRSVAKENRELQAGKGGGLHEAEDCFSEPPSPPAKPSPIFPRKSPPEGPGTSLLGRGLTAAETDVISAEHSIGVLGKLPDQHAAGPFLISAEETRKAGAEVAAGLAGRKTNLPGTKEELLSIDMAAEIAAEKQKLKQKRKKTAGDALSPPKAAPTMIEEAVKGKSRLKLPGQPTVGTPAKEGATWGESASAPASTQTTPLHSEASSTQSTPVQHRPPPSLPPGSTERSSFEKLLEQVASEGPSAGAEEPPEARAPESAPAATVSHLRRPSAKRDYFSSATVIRSPSRGLDPPPPSPSPRVPRSPSVATLSTTSSPSSPLKGGAKLFSSSPGRMSTVPPKPSPLAKASRVPNQPPALPKRSRSEGGVKLSAIPKVGGGPARSSGEGRSYPPMKASARVLKGPSVAKKLVATAVGVPIPTTPTQKGAKGTSAPAIRRTFSFQPSRDLAAIAAAAPLPLDTEDEALSPPGAKTGIPGPPPAGLKPPELTVSPPHAALASNRPLVGLQSRIPRRSASVSVSGGGEVPPPRGAGGAAFEPLPAAARSASIRPSFGFNGATVLQGHRAAAQVVSATEVAGKRFHKDEPASFKKLRPAAVVLPPPALRGVAYSITSPPRPVNHDPPLSPAKTEKAEVGQVEENSPPGETESPPSRGAKAPLRKSPLSEGTSDSGDVDLGQGEGANGLVAGACEQPMVAMQVGGVDGEDDLDDVLLGDCEEEEGMSVISESPSEEPPGGGSQPELLGGGAKVEEEEGSASGGGQVDQAWGGQFPEDQVLLEDVDQEMPELRSFTFTPPQGLMKGLEGMESQQDSVDAAGVELWGDDDGSDLPVADLEEETTAKEVEGPPEPHPVSNAEEGVWAGLTDTTADPTALGQEGGEQGESEEEGGVCLAAGSNVETPPGEEEITGVGISGPPEVLEHEVQEEGGGSDEGVLTTEETCVNSEDHFEGGNQTLDISTEIRASDEPHPPAPCDFEKPPPEVLRRGRISPELFSLAVDPAQAVQFPPDDDPPPPSPAPMTASAKGPLGGLFLGAAWCDSPAVTPRRRGGHRTPRLRGLARLEVPSRESDEWARRIREAELLGEGGMAAKGGSVGHSPPLSAPETPANPYSPIRKQEKGPYDCTKMMTIE